MSALLARTSAELLAVEQELAQEEEEEEEEELRPEQRGPGEDWYAVTNLSFSKELWGPLV